MADKNYSLHLSQEKILFWLKKRWLWLSFLGLSVILPLIWFSADFLYLPEENLFANYQIIFDKYFYAWQDKLNYGGTISPNNFSLLIPNALFYKLLNLLGLKNHILQIVYLQVFLFLSFLAISYFLKLFTYDRKIIFLGSLIYIFHFYFYQALAYSAKMSQIILVPLFFYWMHQFLKTKKLKYAVYNFLGLLFLQNIFCNLPQLISTFGSYIISISYFLTVKKLHPKHFLRENYKRIIIFFIVLSPVFFLQGIMYYFSVIEQINTVKQYSTFSALASPLYLIFQFRGSWWEYQGYNGVPYNHWIFFYDHGLVSLSAFLVFLSPFFILSWRKWERKHIFWWIVFLIFTFLSSGTASAYSLFSLIYEKFPLFYIFREPWAKFMIFVILSFSVLMVIAIDKIKSKKLYAIIIFLIVLKSLNFFSPDFFDHSNEKWKKLFINPPEHWNNFIAWTENNKDKYVLNMPFFRTQSLGFEYNWYRHNLGNSGTSMTAIFGNTNSVRENSLYSVGSPFNDITRYFDQWESVDFVKLGTVNYLLEEKDLMELRSDSDKEDTNSVKKYFEEQPEQSFDNKLFLYKIKSEFYLPHIYIPESIFILNRSIDDVPRLVSSDMYNVHSAIFVKKQNLKNSQKLENIANFRKERVFLSNFQKINPTKYKINIRNSSGIFPLVFLENYNSWWRIYLEEGKVTGSDNIFQTWFRKPLKDENHIIVNGYANGWIIDSDLLCLHGNFCQKNSDGSNNFSLILEFWPQRLFYLGFFILAMAVIAAVGYLIYDRKKKNSKGNSLNEKYSDPTMNMKGKFIQNVKCGNLAKFSVQSKVNKGDTSKKIIFISNVDTGDGMSGGTTIYLNFLNKWKNIHKVFFGSSGTINRLKQEDIQNIEYIEIDNNDNCNLYSLLGILKHTIRRLIRGIKAIRKNLHIAKEASYIYSGSDFYPDFWPAFYAKLKNRKLKWIAGYYLFAPGPFLSVSPYKGINRFRGLLYWLMQRPTYFLARRYADYIFVTSEPDVGKFVTQKRGRDKIIVVQGGVDITESEKYLRSENVIPVEKRKYDACFVGRFHYQKGVLELIDIWKKVLEKKPDAKLAMIGNGGLEGRVMEKIKKYQLKKSIDILGFRDGQEKYEIFKQSKIIVHPATYDSGGMAVAEGMAWKLPGVSFDLEALKTYYPKGMIKTEVNNLDQFAQNIMRLLNDRKYYNKISREAYGLIIKIWDWKKRAEKIYDKIFLL